MNALASAVPVAQGPIGRALSRLAGLVFRGGTHPVARTAPCPISVVDATDCTTFIRIWIDADAVRRGSLHGIHAADNRAHHGSQHQGTPSLHTSVTVGTRICWEIFDISPVSDAVLCIHAIAPAAVFARDAQPRIAPDNHDARTAIAMHPGAARYTIDFSVERPGETPMAFRITPSIQVQEGIA